MIFVQERQFCSYKASAFPTFPALSALTAFGMETSAGDSVSTIRVCPPRHDALGMTVYPCRPAGALLPRHTGKYLPMSVYTNYLPGLGKHDQAFPHSRAARLCRSTLPSYFTSASQCQTWDYS